MRRNVITYGIAILLVISTSLVAGVRNPPVTAASKNSPNLTPGLLDKINKAGGSKESTAAEQGMGINPSSRQVVTSVSGGRLAHECVNDYDVVMPTFTKLDASSVVDAELLSPLRIDDDWYAADHVGVTDTSYGGARHVVKRDGGMQWFGYDADPNNDLLLREYTGSIHSINVKQAPVRADWHTVNGSGIVFGASFAPPKDGEHELGYKSTATFSGYSFVATQHNIEIRYYAKTALSSFSDGSAEYEVLYQTAKKCNSQSLTIEFTEKGPIFKVGMTELDASIDYKPNGDWIGAMVDYATHACPSLSTVYMFNFTVDGENFF